jgi:hypothetical protein
MNKLKVCKIRKVSAKNPLLFIYKTVGEEFAPLLFSNVPG